MARLRDIPVVLRTVGPLVFLKRIVREILDDNLFTLAGGLAYAWLFAIFPFCIFLMNLFPLIVDRHQRKDVDDTKAAMKYFMDAALPDPASNALWSQMDKRIEAVILQPSSSIASLSLLIALWAASKGIGVTMGAMEKCYELEKGRAFYTRRPMAFGLTMMVSGLVFLLVLLLPAGTAFKRMLTGSGEHFSYWLTLLFDCVRTAAAIAVVLLILAVLYHFGAGVRHRWRYLTPGSVFVLSAWVGIGFAFRYYVNRFGKTSYEATYGSVGSAAVLMLLFYLDALILLIGAQINSEIDFEVLNVPRGARNFLKAEGLSHSSTDGSDESSAQSSGSD